MVVATPVFTRKGYAKAALNKEEDIYNTVHGMKEKEKEKGNYGKPVYEYINQKGHNNYELVTAKGKILKKLAKGESLESKDYENIEKIKAKEKEIQNLVMPVTNPSNISKRLQEIETADKHLWAKSQETNLKTKIMSMFQKKKTEEQKKADQFARFQKYVAKKTKKNTQRASNLFKSYETSAQTLDRYKKEMANGKKTEKQNILTLFQTELNKRQAQSAAATSTGGPVGPALASAVPAVASAVPATVPAPAPVKTRQAVPAGQEKESVS